MERSRMIFRTAVAALFAISLPLTGCSGSGGEAGGAGETTGVDVTHASGPSAVAIREADLSANPAVGDPGGLTTPSGDPNALIVFVGDDGVTCDEPYGWSECGSHWSFMVTLPVGLQQPGTYGLAPDPDGTHAATYGFATGSGSGHAGDDCSFGAGTVQSGSIEVTSLDDHEVKGHLHADSIDPSIGVVDLDFVAPRCD